MSHKTEASMPRKSLIITFLILAVTWGVVFGIPYARKMRNEQLIGKELQAGAIVIEETTVGRVNGIRVGASNFGEEYTNAEGVKRNGPSMWLSVLSGEKSESILAYPGRTITIGGQSYRVNRIRANKGENGWVSLLSVDGQGETNIIDMVASKDVYVKEMQFREQETKVGATVIIAGQQGQKVGVTPIFAVPLEIAQQNNPYGNNPVFDLRTSLSIQLPDGVWQTFGQEPDNPRTPAHIIGDIVEISGKQYRVNFLWRSEGQAGWVSLLPVQGPETDLSSLAPPEIHIRKRNATEILLGPRQKWNGILVELQDLFVAAGGNWELNAAIAGNGSIRAEIKDGKTARAQYVRYFSLAKRNTLFQMLIDQNIVSLQPEQEPVFIREVQVSRAVKIFNSQGESYMFKFGLKTEPLALDTIWDTLVRLVLDTNSLNNP